MPQVQVLSLRPKEKADFSSAFSAFSQVSDLMYASHTKPCLLLVGPTRRALRNVALRPKRKSWLFVSFFAFSQVPDLMYASHTKEKLIEKQTSDFFANASHELKTPITVMQGFAEVLMNKEGMDDTSKKQLGRIYKESQRLGSLISDMLMLSKIESGDAPVRALSEVALEDIAKEVLDGLSEKAQGRNITLNTVGSAKICADQAMIFELVENLVSNAIKYNKDGGSVTVSITETDTGVCLKVEDTGIGIEKEHLPRLCERFYRVDKSHSKRIGGTGLGLAIVKHICAISDAELSIQSEFGVGTTVTVVFSK